MATVAHFLDSKLNSVCALALHAVAHFLFTIVVMSVVFIIASLLHDLCWQNGVYGYVSYLPSAAFFMICAAIFIWKIPGQDVPVIFKISKASSSDFIIERCLSLDESAESKSIRPPHEPPRNTP